MTVSGGDLLVDNYRRTVQVVGDFKTMEDIENVIIKSEADAPSTSAMSPRFGLWNKKRRATPGIPPAGGVLDIIKRAGENLIAASDGINRIIAEAEASYLLPT